MSSSIINHPATAVNPLKELTNFGQAGWLDDMRRHLISSGELRKLVEEDRLGGVTLQKDKSQDAMAIYERPAIKDIQDAADALRPVYDGTKRRVLGVHLSEVQSGLATLKTTVEKALA
jgi:hypothetical protein